MKKSELANLTAAVKAIEPRVDEVRAKKERLNNERLALPGEIAGVEAGLRRLRARADFGEDVAQDIAADERRLAEKKTRLDAIGADDIGAVAAAAVQRALDELNVAHEELGAALGEEIDPKIEEIDKEIRQMAASLMKLYAVANSLRRLDRNESYEVRIPSPKTGENLARTFATTHELEPDLQEALHTFYRTFRTLTRV